MQELTREDFEQDFSFVYKSDTEKKMVFDYVKINEPGVSGGRIFYKGARVCDVLLNDSPDVILFTSALTVDTMSGRIKISNYVKI
jgi:hypothetical protein